MAKTQNNWHLIDFDTAVVRRNGSVVLVVSGKKPYANMAVRLSTVAFMVTPEYWPYKIEGSEDGPGLPVQTPYEISKDISYGLGTKGIEVIGKSSRDTIDNP
jgi:hypothetical protein